MRLFSGRPATRATTRSIRLQVNRLEDRTVPAITLHNGAGFPHGALIHAVDIQNVYLGSGWSGSPDRTADILKFDDFSSTVVAPKTGYMTALRKAGYGVGPGKAEAGFVDAVPVGPVVDDTAIQAELQALITAGNVQPWNKNRLYCVFVQPSTEVTAFGANSANDFCAYHSAFSGTYPANVHGQIVNKPAAIFYAVMPYQGTGPNAQNPAFEPNGVFTLTHTDAITVAASHEIIEAATDAVPGEGWLDDNTGEEIGDTVNSEDMILDGFVLQKQGDKTGTDSSLPLPKGAVNFAYFSGVVQPPATAVAVPPPGDLPGSPTQLFGSPTGVTRLVNDPAHNPDESAWDPSTLYAGTNLL